jgi:benzylsuccinate CoA-transferase BbsF subunit
MKGNILSGVRVIDFTRVLSGPYATRMLADFGAEIIKVQSRKTQTVETSGSGYFYNWNRNKRSVTLDMSYPEARSLALKMVAISDVLIENFSPRVMFNWGMDYQHIQKVRPEIIMLSMSGMGQTGPWKNYVAYGPTVQALGGLSFLTSFDKETPLGPGHALADHISGLYGVLAVLAALENREKSGQGQYIDLSQYEVVASMIGPALLDVLANDKDPLPQGNQSAYQKAAPHGCYQCLGADRWCVIGVFNEQEWRSLVEVMGTPDWSSEERFSTLPARKSHYKILDEKINGWTSKLDAEEVVSALQAVGVPAGIVQNAKDLANDPQLLARNYFVGLEHSVFGHTVTERPPILCTQSHEPLQKQSKYWRSSPQLGEGNRYVYLDLLKLSEAEYSSYVEKGIIA